MLVGHLLLLNLFFQLLHFIRFVLKQILIDLIQVCLHLLLVSLTLECCLKNSRLLYYVPFLHGPALLLLLARGLDIQKLIRVEVNTISSHKSDLLLPNFLHVRLAAKAFTNRFLLLVEGDLKH